MNRTQRLFTVTLVCASTSGCGTLLTRGEGAFVGAYPFEAVVADGGMILGLFEHDQEKAWVAGRDKSRHRTRERARAEAARTQETGAESSRQAP